MATGRTGGAGWAFGHVGGQGRTGGKAGQRIDLYELHPGGLLAWRRGDLADLGQRRLAGLGHHFLPGYLHLLLARGQAEQPQPGPAIVLRPLGVRTLWLLLLLLLLLPCLAVLARMVAAGMREPGILHRLSSRVIVCACRSQRGRVAASLASVRGGVTGSRDREGCRC